MQPMHLSTFTVNCGASIKYWMSPGSPCINTCPQPSAMLLYNNALFHATHASVNIHSQLWCFHKILDESRQSMHQLIPIAISHAFIQYCIFPCNPCICPHSQSSVVLPYNTGWVQATHASVHTHSHQPCFYTILHCSMQPMHLSTFTVICGAFIQHWMSPGNPCICPYPQPSACIVPCNRCICPHSQSSVVLPYNTGSVHAAYSSVHKAK